MLKAMCLPKKLVRTLAAALLTQAWADGYSGWRDLGLLGRAFDTVHSSESLGFVEVGGIFVAVQARRTLGPELVATLEHERLHEAPGGDGGIPEGRRRALVLARTDAEGVGAVHGGPVGTAQGDDLTSDGLSYRQPLFLDRSVGN